MSEPERVFLDWTEATAPAVARWLRGRAAKALVIIPTQESGRRLRRELGESDDRPPPLMLTPAQFLQPEGDDLADPLAAAFSLAAELTEARAAHCEALFPAGVPLRDFAERLALARAIRGLQEELAANGLTIFSAADRLGPGSAEGGRWRDLGALIGAADRTLARSNLREREAARLHRAQTLRLPAGVEEVVVAGIADLQPIVARALERVPEKVTVLIASPEEPDSFDAWGRPRANAWIDRDPGWHDFERQVNFVARPDGLEKIPDAPEEPGLEIGLLDRELLPALKEALAARECALHDPTGQPLAAHWLARTVGALGALVAAPAFDQAVDLLRNGAIRTWITERRPGLDLEQALRAADRIRVDHFPATLRAAQPWVGEVGPLPAALALIGDALGDLRAQPAKATWRLAREIGEAFQPMLEPPEGVLLDSALKSLEATIERLQSATRNHSLPPSDWLYALQDAMGSIRLYPQRPPGAVDAAGWAELPWSAAPHLVLAGMNLGKVPAPGGSELFLGEATRVALGLPAADERRARDAYFLARMLAMRPPGKGRLDVLVVRANADGSPLEPSPLLLAGAGEQLPSRVERLFADPPAPPPDPAWTSGWQLDPPVIEMKPAVAVTDFQRYLDCPFTFYLRRVVRMEMYEPAADELDAAQFGDLAHYALQQWAMDDAARESADPAVITRALEAEISTWVEKNLGRRLSLPLRVQVESVRARLAAFANWQAGDRREGWRIRGIEQSFEEILGRKWEIAGWTVSGRVDRLDENERDGRWRVIDYKTFDAADRPAKKHLRAFRSADRIWPPDYARVADSANWWINLQLPLYRQLLIESGRDAGATVCGYFNLPKTIAETGLQTWDDFDETLQASAMKCARGVLADLGRRRFWPPNPRAEYADFAALFPPDAKRVINPQGAFVRSCAP